MSYLDDLNENDEDFDPSRRVDEERLRVKITEWEGHGASHEEALDIARCLECNPTLYDMLRARYSEY